MGTAIRDDKATILAICGSLRPKSANAAVIAVARAHIGKRINFIVYDGLASIPPFDDSKKSPDAVTDFRKRIANADGVLICSPEYAFGVPGALKNAIDWTVSSGEFVKKPLALITAATGGEHAHAALLHTFTALSVYMSDSSKLLIPFIRAKMNGTDKITDAATKKAINAVVDSLMLDIACQYMY